MIVATILVAAGLFLSAFFSGSETGFYRVTRVRLVMDAKSGKWIARSLLWLISRPSIVVATVLIGNNIANYMVSLGLLLASQSLLSNWNEQIQTFLPVLATPFLFVYGELLPKYLYYNAPYILSTRGAPVMIVCAALFIPISSLIILLEWTWHRMFGTESVRSKFSLERQELQRVLLESQEAGILHPLQRELAQNVFTYGVRPVRHFALPVRAMLTAKNVDDAVSLVQQAQRMQQRYVCIQAEPGAEIDRCFQVVDLVLAGENAKPQLVSTVRAEESGVQVLSQLQRDTSPLARVIDANGNTLGVATQDRLMALLLPDR